MTPTDALAALAEGQYAFIDLGSGTGGSIDHCVRRFGRSPGLGFERNAELATAGREAGFAIVVADIRAIELPPSSVDFVSSMDFLEHLPDLATAGDVLRRSTPAARDFLFIRHPSFEDIDFLAVHGLKQCWTDWSDHPNMMRLADIEAMFEHFGWSEYAIFPRAITLDSSDDEIVPISAPTDTMTYDASAHGPKPLVLFDRPVFAQFDIFVRLNEQMTDDEWSRVLGAGLQEDAPLWPARYVTPQSERTLRPHDLGFYDPGWSRFSIGRIDGSSRSVKYGAENRGWQGFAGDFAGHGSPGFGVYDPSTGSFFLRDSPSEGEADVTIGFGAPGGIAIAGDWTASGRDTIGVYAPETAQWFLRHENSNGPADESFSFGAAGGGCLPIVGDWDGDGSDSIGLYDPANSSWHIRRSHRDGRADLSFTFGPAGALPVSGDWSGSGRDGIGLYVPAWGLWLLRSELSNGPADAMIRHPGIGTPIVGHFDGR